MTDNEMTRLCAEAMGLETRMDLDGNNLEITRFGCTTFETYDPLHDDEQAMALVKKFRINICWFEVNAGTPFKPTIFMWWRKPEELNRAIVECVAKMRAGEK